METIQQKLLAIYKDWSGKEAVDIKPISSAGSNRKYFRIFGGKENIVGAYNEDIKENVAFFHFTSIFKGLKLAVPEIYFIDKSKQFYLLGDLGDQSLFDKRMLEPNETLGEQTKELYKKSLRSLLIFQFEAYKIIDFKKCYPRQAMDRQSFLWDLNYFKYYFLKPKNILFDEQKLEDDFNALIDLLLEADQNHFICRDFQSRNIMIKNGEPYFIDYQGGRKGALQYDLASFLYQVKAQIPSTTKTELIDYYLHELKSYSAISKNQFLTHFYPYVFIRLIQVMGAYGFRGLIEKRSHFIESIPLAVGSLKENFPNFDFLNNLPELKKCVETIVAPLQEELPKSNLLVQIKSFAYKKGIPKDESGHGEGFVFDCRALPNPGRLKQYQHLNGKDDEVINYLKGYREVLNFKDHVFQIIDQSINNYIERGFTNLNINFGCTGGQHRSVFFAESVSKHLTKKYNINIQLTHTNKANWK